MCTPFHTADRSVVLPLIKPAERNLVWHPFYLFVFSFNLSSMPMGMRSCTVPAFWRNNEEASCQRLSQISMLYPDIDISKPVILPFVKRHYKQGKQGICPGKPFSCIKLGLIAAEPLMHHHFIRICSQKGVKNS